MKTAQQWFDEMKERPCVTEADLLVIIQRIQEDAYKPALQRAVNAEMELLALKSPPIPDHIRAKMDEDRARMELLAQKTPVKGPDFLSQALNEGDGTYKP